MQTGLFYLILILIIKIRRRDKREEEMSDVSEDARDREEFLREMRIVHKYGNCDLYPYCPYCEAQSISWLPKED